MGLVLVKGMPLEPHACVHCGGGARDASGQIDEVVFTEAVDINWGDSVYTCRTCARVIAELYGFASPEEVKTLNDRLAELKKVEEEYEELKKRVKRILKGSKARKEVMDSA